MKWDSEVVTEGTTHCPGWTGKRFGVPEDIQNPLWPGTKDYTPPPPLPYRPIDFACLVKEAFGQKPFGSHRQWMGHCHYFSCLWSPPEAAASDLKQFVGTSSSSATSSSSSGSGVGSERSSTTDTEPSKRNQSPTPAFVRKRSRTDEFTRPDNYSHGNKRARRSKSLESVVEYEAEQASWTTRRVGELVLPPSLPKLKGKEREQPPPVVSLRETSPSEAGLPTLADLSPNPRKFAGRMTGSSPHSSRRHMSTLTDSCRSSPARSTPSARRTRANAPPLDCCPRPKSERKCSVIVKDGEEDKVWFMSKEALQDVKGYLQVKKAAGAAIEVFSGEEGDVRHPHLRVERVLRSPSTRPTRKRGSSPEDNDEIAQKPKRRRSWPDVDPYGSKLRTSSLPFSD